MTDWRAEAACLGTDPETFFPATYAPRRSNAALSAPRAVCAACPVQVDCLDMILSVPSQFDVTGVYAGLTPSERRSLRDDDRSLVVDTSPDALANLRGGPLEGRLSRDGTTRAGVPVHRSA